MVRFDDFHTLQFAYLHVKSLLSFQLNVPKTWRHFSVPIVIPDTNFEKVTGAHQQTNLLLMSMKAKGFYCH